MTIKIQNKYLNPSIAMLRNMPLTGKDSRSRTKFVKLLANAFKDLQESNEELLKESCELNEDGTVKKDGDNPVFLDGKLDTYLKEFNDLMDEETLIDGGIYVNNIDKLPKILEDCQSELSGDEADAYDMLLDAFEAIEQ